MAPRPARRSARGVRKNYNEASSIVLDDDEEPIQVPDDDRDIDDDFGSGSNGVPDFDGDGHGADDDPRSDGDEVDEDGNPKTTTASKSQQKGKRNAGAGMIQSRKGFHDIPHYPLETRIVTRVYAGPLRRYARYSALRDSMYGPEIPRIRVIWALETKWSAFPVLPPKAGASEVRGIMPSPWVPQGFEKNQTLAASKWYEGYHLHCPVEELQVCHHVAAHQGESLVPNANGELVALLGPWDRQREFILPRRGSLEIAENGSPFTEDDIVTDGEEARSRGWMIDVGGIPLAIAWAPFFLRNNRQVLAVATIPFSDQDSSLVVEENSGNHNATSEIQGSVQFWEFAAEEDSSKEGMATPAKRPSRLLGAKCFSWGRPKRMQFCPVPMDESASPSTNGILAVLCSDGRVRVIDCKAIHEDQVPDYACMEAPMVTFGQDNDYNVEVTCLTWANTNRLALGHSDGSITLWSVYPKTLLQRHGAHTTYVIDICSAYPSNPYLVASVPVGGCATLTDMSHPSSEFTYFPVPAISFQPNLLCWNESMQGFMALYPSSTPNTTIAFLHHRFFAQARSICTGPNTLTCVSVGTTHPFILVGCADGSVFACNALQKLFKQKGEPLRKLKIFEHEYRPVVATRSSQGNSIRGAVRILQGYLPEVNDDPRTEKRKEMDRKKRLEREKKSKYTASGKKKGRPKKNAGLEPEQPEEEHDLEGELQEKLASRVVIHEPLTRVTAVAWNPNTNFSCWAASAMASGIIKVMDLGVEDFRA